MNPFRPIRALHRLLRAVVLLALSTSWMSATAAAVDDRVLIVLNSGDATISLVDPLSLKTLRTLDTGKEPHHLMPMPGGRELVVASSAGNSLMFLDGRTGAVQRIVRGIDDPYQLAFSPDRKWFAVTCLRLNRVDLYEADGFKLVKRIPIGKLPSHLVFSPDSAMLFVTLQGSDEVAGIDVRDQAVRWVMKVGKLPAGIAMTPDGRQLMVGIMGEDYVDVIDWHRQKSVVQLKTGRGAHNFLPMGDKRRVLVSNRVENTVSIVDTTNWTKLADIRVPGGPDCMELTADGRTLYVTSRWIKRVSVVDLVQGAVIAQAGVGRSPHGIYFDSHAARQ